jgi:hypothetical protein
MAAATMYVTPTGAGTKAGGSWANAMDNATFQTDFMSSCEAGDIYYVAGGTYSVAASLASARNGTTTSPILLIGVKATTTAEPPTLSDWASGDDRPYFDDGGSWHGNDMGVGSYWVVRNIRIRLNTYYTLKGGNSSFINVKATNPNSSSSTYVMFPNGQGANTFGCEIVGGGGSGLLVANYSRSVGNYITGCDTGIVMGAGNFQTVTNNIVYGCTIGIKLNNGGYCTYVSWNTVVGSTKIGTTGIMIGTGFYGSAVTHNTFTHLGTGGSWADAMSGNSIVDYNNFYDNTTDRADANFPTGVHDTAVDPGFVNAAGGDFSLTGISAIINGGMTMLASGGDKRTIGAWEPQATILSVPTFAGIVQLEAVGGGCLRATWAAGSGTITGYNIYIRAGSASVFSSTYLKMRVDSSSTEAIFRMDADNSTFLTTANTYYVGVRAENSGVEDANAVTYSATIEGDGTVYMKMTDVIGIIT